MDISALVERSDAVRPPIAETRPAAANRFRTIAVQSLSFRLFGIRGNGIVLLLLIADPRANHSEYQRKCLIERSAKITSDIYANAKDTYLFWRS